MQSQPRNGFTYAFTGAPRPTLSGNGGTRRVSLVCDPNLPRSERTFERQFRTECVQPGGGASDPYYLGTSTNDEYNRSGYINHDITFFKNFAHRAHACCSSEPRSTTRSTPCSTRLLMWGRCSTTQPERRRTPTSDGSPVFGPRPIASFSSACGLRSRRRLARLRAASSLFEQGRWIPAPLFFCAPSYAVAQFQSKFKQEKGRMGANLFFSWQVRSPSPTSCLILSILWRHTPSRYFAASSNKRKGEREPTCFFLGKFAPLLPPSV